MKQGFLFIALFSALAFTSCWNKTATELFNGEDLAGWVCVVDGESSVPADEVFGVRDGNIHITGTPFGYMRTAGQYSNYKLHVQWRWVGEATNSGIFLHVQDGDKLWPNAIECQLKAGRAGDFVMLGGSKIAEVESAGAFPIKARNDDADCEKAAGEWNTAQIVCAGDRIAVYINGVLQNECSATNGKGYIALQSEGGPLEFRNVYLTTVK
ncbi:DUF1080 domain-containing protein [uncultured Alistipes sp.]|jgi:hypothetical protein|uniref:3-keto-disaccharide hydrolase n=1 Tax=uncultured Alistipes sp. TaxID=538949 RepID=UPI0025FA8810|nr:DUF1080 domain-containing protein [uncultured Alistipes sp.]